MACASQMGARPKADTERLCPPLNDGVLILLFLWAVAAVILEKAAKEPDPSCHVFFREGVEHPMSDC